MKKYIVFCIVFLLTLSVSAQTLKKYNGQITKPDWLTDMFADDYYEPDVVNGTYTYYENEAEERIIHGNFKIIYYDNVEIQGSYNNGKRDGLWTKKKKLKNGNYDTKYLVSLRYKNGVLDGPFTIILPYYLIEINGSFSDNLMCGKLTIRTQCVVVSGLINKNGNPHGVWIEKYLSDKVVPKDITRLYDDGYLLYRREKDLSSGKIKYTYSISDNIRTPADTIKVNDTIVYGVTCVNVGGVLCCRNRDENPSSCCSYEDDFCTNNGLNSYNHNGDLWGVCTNNGILWKIYPTINNWCVKFDPERCEKEIKERKRLLQDDDVNYSVESVETAPEFPGGSGELNKFIAKNLIYPELAKDNGITGKVYVSFNVEKDGTITNVRIMRDIGGGCGAAAVKLIKSMPKWIPGMQKGIPVRTSYTLPINYSIK